MNIRANSWRVLVLVACSAFFCGACNLFVALDDASVQADADALLPDVTADTDLIDILNLDASAADTDDATSADADPADVAIAIDVEPDVATPVDERVHNGLMLYYSFEEGAGATARDRSALAPAIDLTIGGAVSWLDNPRGVRLSGGSLASGGGSAKLAERVAATGELTFEIWIKSTTVNQGQGSLSTARIFSISQAGSERNFTFGQNSGKLEIRFRTSAATNSGQPFWSINSAFDTSLTHYAVSYDGERIKLYINSMLVADDARTGNLASWDATLNVIIGDELGGGFPWAGNVNLVALYDRVLSAAEISRTLAPAPPDSPWVVPASLARLERVGGQIELAGGVDTFGAGAAHDLSQRAKGD